MKPNYTKGIIIVHGKSERIFAEYIKSNLHLPIEIYHENTSIQIDSLPKVLGNTIFKSKTSLKKEYYIEEKKGKLVNLFVMPIMDLDDTIEEKIEKYKNKEMFKNHWLYGYITPIWNDKNFEQVLYDSKLISRIPNYKEKVKMYRGIISKNNEQADIDCIREHITCFITINKTNMNILIEKCLEGLQKFN